MQTIEQQMLAVIPYQVGNIVEYVQDGSAKFGRVEEVNMNFKHDRFGKKSRVAFRVNEVLVNYDEITRKVSET